MTKTILITGSTDGIGLEAARLLAAQGHRILVHGRNPKKLADTQSALCAVSEDVEAYLADLSILAEVEKLADAVKKKHTHLDVLINNAGVYHPQTVVTATGLDARFVVNTIAPYLLMKRLLPVMDNTGRVVNLSSAAQAPVEPAALTDGAKRTDAAAYAQSKLALTMWSSGVARSLGDAGPSILALNPGSYLGTKMVHEAFGVDGHPIAIGAEVVASAAISEAFDSASGQYYDNDTGAFASPHPDGEDVKKTADMVAALEALIQGR